ncbi:fatty acid desaturase [Hasllibacter sp. MH4015]|uniref:fatty acid desaturase n=1 Tax=Hasllibacter sp. MH4015 TaxID=2854029 RepID=UPI001CD39BC5|nr:fatty acid desaturase [Hasllibacter sp. MH4015]
MSTDPALDHRAFLASLPPEDRARFTARSDRAGLLHLAGHVGLIAACASYVAWGGPLWWLVLLPLGITLTFLFTLQHECTHRTPFASPWLNDAVGHLCGIVLVQPFLWFRAFHMAHHKHTNDPELDPELSDGKPETLQALLWHLSTIGYWRAKLSVLLGNASGPSPAPFIADRQRGPIRVEARVYLAIYAAAFLAMVSVAPILFWIWLLPLILGFPVLRLYLLAEHDRCPQVANMFANSRTTTTTRIVNFLAWNMPYHAEHHAWPMVPFHALPGLHELAEPHLHTKTDGYARFARDTFESRAAGR